MGELQATPSLHQANRASGAFLCSQPRESQAERLASVCDTRRSLAPAWGGERAAAASVSAGLSVVLPNMCGEGWKNYTHHDHTLAPCCCTHLVYVCAGVGRRWLCETYAGLRHAGRMSSSSSSSGFAVGRAVEAAQWTRLGEIGKSESTPLPSLTHHHLLLLSLLSISLSFCSSVHRRWPISVDRRRQRSAFFVCGCVQTCKLDNP